MQDPDLPFQTSTNWFRRIVYLSNGQYLLALGLTFISGLILAQKFQPVPRARTHFPVRGHLWLTVGPLKGFRPWLRMECLILGHGWILGQMGPLGPQAVGCRHCRKMLKVSGL